MPFINIERKKRKQILENKIDQQNFLGLFNDRGRLIALGVSLGLDRPTPITNKDALSRQEYVERNHELKTIMACVAIEHMKENDDLNEVLSDSNRFNLTDECLNRGLDVIEDQIDSIPADNYRLRLIEDLELLYEENVKDYK